MESAIETEACKPLDGRVFPGTWPDCLDCHGNGFTDKNAPTIPCQACQDRSAAIGRSLADLVEFEFYGRPENYVPIFPHEGEEVKPAWIDITWAEVLHGRGLHFGTWPDCSECHGLGQRRYETGWDGHRPDYNVLQCATCQLRTREFRLEHPNEKDLLLQKQVLELKSMKQRHKTELEEAQQRHTAEIDALPF